MHILADLGAASNRHPGIHHGALIDKSADVDEAGHQHDIPGDMRSMPCNGPRHSAETGGAELRLAPALKFRGHLVPPMRAAGAAGNKRVVIEAEGQQYRLLQPLIDAPRSEERRVGQAGVSTCKPRW